MERMGRNRSRSCCTFCNCGWISAGDLDQEWGCPACWVTDAGFDTLEDDAVTVRNRDTMTQERVSLEGIETYLAERLPGC